MSYAEKRGDHLTGGWYGEVRNHPKGGRFRLRFKTKDRADAYEAHVKVFGEEPDWAREDTDEDVGLTFAAVVDQCKAAGGPRGKWKRNRDPAGQGRLEFVKAFFIKTGIDKVDRSALDRLVSNLERRPGRNGEYLDNDTINRYLSMASAVLTWAHEHEIIRGKPSVPWQPKTGGRIHWLTEDQELAICRWLSEAQEPACALSVRFLCASGLRWGEYENLSPTDVRDRWVSLDQTKTDVPRDVPVNDELCRLVRGLIASGGRPEYYTIRRRFKSAVQACGYAAELTLHSCRHTTATRLALRDWNVFKIKDFMGHKSISTTEKYTHIQKSALAELANSLDPHRGKTDENASSSAVVAVGFSTKSGAA